MAVKRKRRPTTEPSPSTPDPIEIAMEAEAGEALARQLNDDLAAQLNAARDRLLKG